jgi:hypothetical protein
LVDGNYQVAPWALTREHVAARRGNDAAAVNTIGNLVPCGLMMNRMASHMPLAVKLYEKDMLASFCFDREAMTLETALAVRDEIIRRVERPFWFEGNYPWFPHAYSGAPGEAARKHARKDILETTTRREPKVASTTSGISVV